MVWQTKLKFEMAGALPQGVSTAKMVNFWSGTIELRICENSIFLVPVKHTLVCRVPALAVLGRTTHYRMLCALMNIIFSMQNSQAVKKAVQNHSVKPKVVATKQLQ